MTKPLKYQTAHWHPIKATSGSAGYDLTALNDYDIPKNKVWNIQTGVRVEIPEGHFGLLTLRSSMGSKGIIMPHGVGIIDSDYRGEINIRIMSLLGKTRIRKGARIAQLTIIPTPNIHLVEADNLTATERGEGGFGSTGK